MDPKHQFAAQYVLSRTAAERRERENILATAGLTNGHLDEDHLTAAAVGLGHQAATSSSPPLNMLDGTGGGGNVRMTTGNEINGTGSMQQVYPSCKAKNMMRHFSRSSSDRFSLAGSVAGMCCNL